ncbi:hypothetical protein PAEPH01_1687 [Pancytospora epiphaga]|nr:hypothetical protein PAEPH01_1687 [Pancytospora epiphaga]
MRDNQSFIKESFNSDKEAMHEKNSLKGGSTHKKKYRISEVYSKWKNQRSLPLSLKARRRQKETNMNTPEICLEYFVKLNEKLDEIENTFKK